MNKIKTLIFDLGGVFFTSGTSLALKKLIDEYDITDKNAVQEFFSDKPGTEGNLIRLGLIDINEFEKRFYSKFNIIEKRKEHLRNIWFNSYCPHYNMKKIVENLKNRYRLIIFSGNVKERIQFLDNKYDFRKFFSDFVFSYDYQKNKNEKEFYEILLKHLDCKPPEAILIDDEKRSIKMARSYGLNGIYFCYPEQLIEELKEFNVEINP